MTRVEKINFEQLGKDSDAYKLRLGELENSGYRFVGARSDFPEDLVNPVTKNLKPGYAVVKNPSPTEKYPFVIYINDKLIKQA